MPLHLMKHKFTKDQIRRGIIRRLYGIKTAAVRAFGRRLSEETLLRRRILRRINELGRRQEDGNSELVEHTYHPIPFPEFQKVKSHRLEMEGRLSAILSAVGPVDGEWILDIGANVGYFAFSLERKGALVEAYESDSTTFEIGAALSRLYRTNVLYINKPFGSTSLRYLRDRYRVVLLLSVFHWILKQEGLAAATGVLQSLAARADWLIFETPCTGTEGVFAHEMFSSEARLDGFLRATLPSARISILLVDNAWGGRNLYCIDTRGSR